MEGTQLMEELRCQREADEKMQRLAKAESHYHLPSQKSKGVCGMLEPES